MTEAKLTKLLGILPPCTGDGEHDRTLHREAARLVREAALREVGEWLEGELHKEGYPVTVRLALRLSWANFSRDKMPEEEK